MPFVTAATANDLDAVSYPYEGRDDAILKAIELVESGAESVSVTDIESKIVLTGDELLDAVKELASRGGAA